LFYRDIQYYASEQDTGFSVYMNSYTFRFPAHTHTVQASEDNLSLGVQILLEENKGNNVSMCMS